MARENVDTVILGCTHYPLLTDAIQDYFGAGVKLIDPGAELARELKRMMPGQSGENKNGAVSASFYVSDSTESFSELAGVFLGVEEGKLRVEKVEVDL